MTGITEINGLIWDTWCILDFFSIKKQGAEEFCLLAVSSDGVEYVIKN